MNESFAVFEKLIAANRLLFYYSPYNFDRNIAPEKLIAHMRQKYVALMAAGRAAHMNVDGDDFIILYERLEWDTDYFGMESYKIHFVLSADHATQLALDAALGRFADECLPQGAYCFVEAPSEDINMLQALSGNGYRLIETRLTYYHNTLASHAVPRYETRTATAADAGNLRRVACEMRNSFDRFHADPAFNQRQADDFLATYIENSVKGFADVVMVPAGPGVPPDSFLTANYLRDEWPLIDYPISKMVLSAVSAATNKGWYVRLISEMLYHLRDDVGAASVYLNTQSTNRAVFSTWEKLGFRLGCTTHVFSLKK